MNIVTNTEGGYIKILLIGGIRNDVRDVGTASDNTPPTFQKITLDHC